MTAIAFFWRGPRIDIPEMLLESIRLIHGDRCHITQVSDKGTPHLELADAIITDEFDSNIMIARLQGFSRVPIQESFTYFCDADSLVVNEVNIESEIFSADVILNRRQEDFFLNYRWPEYYPEFEGKRIMDMMPFLFGGIAVRKDDKLFLDLIKICKTLNPRFWRWYGDQVSLKGLWDQNPSRFGLFRNDAFLTIIRQALTQEDVTHIRKNGARLITFKGPNSKVFMKPTLESLRGVYLG